MPVLVAVIKALSLMRTLLDGAKAVKGIVDDVREQQRVKREARKAARAERKQAKPVEREDDDKNW